MSSARRSPAVVRNVRLWTTPSDSVDIEIDAGKVTRITPAEADEQRDAGAYDGRGLLALPGFVNTHAHIDKSWWGLPWQSYGGEATTEGRIRHERAHRDEIGMPSVEITRHVLEQLVAHGTTAIRTHVDVDLGLGLRGIDVVREAVAAYAGALKVEIVAFPQDGVLRRPGVLALLDQAARDGVEHLGGLDPASIDRDPVGQIAALLDLCAEHGVGLDIHLHDPAELGAFQIELILDGVERLALQHRVNIAHGFAVAQLQVSRRRDLLARMGALGVTMTTVAPPRLPPLPVDELDAAGVSFGFGTDGIRDLWSPYGTGDLLAVALQYARSAAVRRDEDLLRVLDIAGGGSAPFVGLPASRLGVGDRADIVLVDAENGMDAVVRTPRRETVIANGQVLVG